MVGVSGGLRMTVLGCCCCRRDGVGDCGPGSGVMELSGESIECRVRVLQINTGKQLDICEVKEGGYTDRAESARQPWNNLGREAKAATTQ